MTDLEPLECICDWFKSQCLIWLIDRDHLVLASVPDQYKLLRPEAWEESEPFGSRPGCDNWRLRPNAWANLWDQQSAANVKWNHEIFGAICKINTMINILL